MKRLVFRGAALALASGLVLAGCGGGDKPTSTKSTEVPSEVRGSITDLARANGKVTGLTVEADGGRTYEIDIDPTRDYGFDLNHLDEHLKEKEAVTVALEKKNGRAVARSIED